MAVLRSSEENRQRKRRETVTMEESQVSDKEFDSDESLDLYGDDPCFQTKEELESFMRSCNIKQNEKEFVGENVFYELHKEIVRECSCGVCQDIWSEGFQHLCCQQVEK